MLQLAADLDSKKQKFVDRSEVPVLCITAHDDVTVVGYKQQLVRCAAVQEGIVALVAVYYVYNINFEAKRAAFMNLMQHVLFERSDSVLAKKAVQLLRNLNM